MSREIKFRAWHNHNKVMIENAHLYYDFCEMIGSKKETYTVEQFTGIKDKLGTETYDGDKIECDGESYEVYWCDDTLSWQCMSKEDCLSLQEFRGDYFITGNIHEEQSKPTP